MAAEGTLVRVGSHEIEISRLPAAPEGREIDRVEVIVRLRESGGRAT